MWPDSEAFNRANLLADYPNDPAAAPWQATREGLDATQGDADAAAKRFWQRSSWYRRAHIHNESLAGQPVIDDLPSQGAVHSERADAAAAGDTMAQRRLEDERFAAFAEVSIVWLDLPDAVFRGYEGDHQLLGAPRDDDPAPADVLRREIARLEPSRVYLPLAIGGHVDHQLARDAGLALLADARRWVMRWTATPTAVPDGDLPGSARRQGLRQPRRHARDRWRRCRPTSRSRQNSPTSATRSSARSAA